MVATPDAAFEEIKTTLERRAWLFVALPLAIGLALFAGVLFVPVWRRTLRGAR